MGQESTGKRLDSSGALRGGRLLARRRGTRVRAGLGPARGGPGQQGELGLVRGQDVGERNRGRVQPVRRRRVQDGGGPGGARRGEGGPDRVGRDLAADEHHVAGSDRQRPQGGRHGRGSRRRVRARGHGDQVLGPFIDHDQGDAGRARGDEQVGHVDPLGDEGGPRGGPEVVVAHRADERHERAEPRGRDRLVAALAAVMPGDVAAGHGLARAGQAGRDHDEVDVDGADDDDAAGRHVRTPGPCARPGSGNSVTPSTAAARPPHDRTKSSWTRRSTVPGRAARTRAIASSGGTPPSTSRQATAVPVRPRPPRQATTTRSPRADPGQHVVEGDPVGGRVAGARRGRERDGG